MRTKKNLPKSLDEIEFVPFVGRDIDLNIKGKPSVYLRNVIIPYYRGVIRGLETEIRNIKKSKGELLIRKDKQIAAKKWLKYKSNQKRYAVQQGKVNDKAQELLSQKIKGRRFADGELGKVLLILPSIERIMASHKINFENMSYLLYTSMFHSVQIKDYQTYFTEGFTRDKLNKLVNAGYLSVFMVNRTNNYTLSIKGLELMKKLNQSLSNEDTGIKGT
jgi:hypothetical protein